MGWEKYQKNLQELMVMNEMDKLQSAVQQNPRVSIAPENEVGLTYGLITPDNPDDIINKNLRIGNLNKKDHTKVLAGGFLITYYEGLIQQKKLELDKNLMITMKEVIKDVNIVQLSSVSVGGALMEGILSPKKRFQILPDRADKKKLEQSREAQR